MLTRKLTDTAAYDHRVGSFTFNFFEHFLRSFASAIYIVQFIHSTYLYLFSNVCTVTAFEEIFSEAHDK